MRKGGPKPASESKAPLLPVAARVHLHGTAQLHRDHAARGEFRRVLPPEPVCDDCSATDERTDECAFAAACRGAHTDPGAYSHSRNEQVTLVVARPFDHAL